MSAIESPSTVAWHLSPGTCRLAHRRITSHRHLHLIVINIERLFEYVRTLPPEHSVAIARMDFSMLAQSLRQRKERSSPISRCPDVVRPEVVRAEVLRSEVVRPEVIRPELLHREVVCPEVVRREVVRPEVVRPATGKLRQVNDMQLLAISVLSIMWG